LNSPAGDLDVSGWDLRKTLRLFGKCNIALNEWLGSPIVYWQAPTFREQLLQPALIVNPGVRVLRPWSHANLVCKYGVQIRVVSRRCFKPWELCSL
jgi:predicted nucleotidyltransferase